MAAQMSWQEVLAEYERERMGPLILEATSRIARHVTKRYDPRIYGGGSQSWTDDELADLVQDFTVQILLGEGQLDYVMTSGSLSSFEALLEFQMRRFMARRRTRTVIDNLVTRSREILHTSPFASRRVGGREGFYLEGQGSGEGPPSEEAIRRAALVALGMPRLAARSGDRAPAIYTTAQLRLVLQGIARALGTEFHLGDLDRVLRLALTPFVGSPLTQVEADVVDESQLSPEDEILAQEAANRMVARLTREQARLLQQKFANVADSDLAKEMGLSRPTVIKRKKEVEHVVAQELGELDDVVAKAALANLASALVETLS